MSLLSPPPTDGRLFSEACARNEAPIAAVLAPLLLGVREVLEIGAGTGQHAAAFARRFPAVTWQAVDRPPSLPSVQAWRAAALQDGVHNLLPPLPFDLFDAQPPVARADLVVAINVLHIAPEEAMPRLFHHARAVLPGGGRVFVYGPFLYPDRPLEPSNAAFDASLRARGVGSGLRDATVLDAIAAQHGFTLAGDVAMPANNRSRWWVLGPS